MKYLIISDTHGQLDNFARALKQEGHIDGLIHCGDVQGDQEEIRRMVGPECPCVFVQGNCDMFYGREAEAADFIIGKHKFHVEHGHRLPDSMKAILYKAQCLGAEVIMFGHTHIPLVSQESGIWVLNPGSLSRPRQSGHQPSYAVMRFEPEGQLNIEIKYVVDF